MAPVKKLLISQFTVQSTTRDDLATRILDRMAGHEKTVLLFANTNFIVNCRFVIEYSGEPSVILVNDGVGMDIAAKLLHGEKFADNLNGTDFTPYLMRQATRPLRVFLLGGKPDILEKAATYAKEVLGQTIAGKCDGYGGLKNAPDILDRINKSCPDILLVAMGNPMQEKWIFDHRHQIDARLFMGVGALFDFWAGGKPRAPAIVRRLRLEWLYRLCHEPKRLLRRYTLDIFVFLRQCFKYK